jgi:hypothetical protein
VKDFGGHTFSETTIVLAEAARILSRIIEKMPAPYTPDPMDGPEDWQAGKAHNALRQAVIDIIFGG